MVAMTSSLNRARTLVPRLATRLVLPLVGYALLRPYVGSDAVALAIAGCVPAAWTIGVLLARRRLDPLGLLGVAGFGMSLLLLWLTGGSAVAVKLGEPVVTGVLGLACLVSVPLGRPLYGLVLRATGRATSAVGAGPLTVIIGAILAVHAAVLVLLAITLSTTDYLAVGRPIGWAVLGVGVAGLFWYRKRASSVPESSQIQPPRQVPFERDAVNRT